MQFGSRLGLPLLLTPCEKLYLCVPSALTSHGVCALKIQLIYFVSHRICGISHGIHENTLKCGLCHICHFCWGYGTCWDKSLWICYLNRNLCLTECYCTFLKFTDKMWSKLALKAFSWTDLSVMHLNSTNIFMTSVPWHVAWWSPYCIFSISVYAIGSALAILLTSRIFGVQLWISCM